MTHPNPWLPLARPVVKRLDRTWRDEDRALAGLSLPDMHLFGATRLGFIERRKHWLTRRPQVRLSLAALTSSKVLAEVQAGRVA